MEVAESLGLSRSKVYALIAAQEIPSVRVGGRTLVPADGLRRWIEEFSDGLDRGHRG